MTPAALAHAENRADLARRLAHEILRRAAEQHVETDSYGLLRFFDDMGDGERFLVWRAARASKCPSGPTWVAARRLLYERLPFGRCDHDRVLHRPDVLCEGFSAEGC